MKPTFEVFRDSKTGQFRWQVLDEKGVAVRFTPGSVVGVRPDRRAKDDVQTMLGMIYAESERSSKSATTV